MKKNAICSNLMTRRISKENVNDSNYIVGMYPTGCEYCAKGEKITFYITFKCNYSCFYCSVPADLRNTERMFVGSVEVENIEDAFKYIKQYKCVAISGGEPLIYIEKVLKIIKMAKKYGIYTYLFTDGGDNSCLTIPLLRNLVKVGLDEIKLSVKLKNERMLSFDPHGIIENSPIPIHAEFPMLPNFINEVYDLILELNDIGISYFILDQLEFSTGNMDELLKRGFRNKNGCVVGSENAALKVVEKAYKDNLNIKVLYCKSQNPKHRYKYGAVAKTC